LYFEIYHSEIFFALDKRSLTTFTRTIRRSRVL